MTLEHTLAKLISFRTVTGDCDEVASLFAWVKDELRPVPLCVREYRHNGLPSLVITPTQRKQIRLWLVAHVDVVAAPDILFTARRVGGRLVGRGAIDMKFAVACYMHLLRDIGIDMHAYDLGIMLTADEEWAGNSSVKYLLEKEGYRGDVAFLPDGYGTWKFEESAKGMWGVEVTTTGVASHGSRPWHGRSAIHELMGFLTEAQARVAERFTIATDDTHWYTTMNIGQIEGGSAFNMVAPNAQATVDVRYTHVRDQKEVERVFRRLTKKYPHTTWRVLHDELPYGIMRSNGYAKAFARIAQSIHGIACGWVRAHGASDARFFNRANIPTILIGPDGGESHGDTEWVDINDLEMYYQVLRQFVEETARR